MFSAGFSTSTWPITPIGDMGPIEVVVDLRGFVPMSGITTTDDVKPEYHFSVDQSGALAR
jgi:hypothetical protein